MSNKLFWGPNIRWQIVDDKLQIEKFTFKGEYFSLFPQFYWAASQGASRERLCELFAEFDQLKLNRFIGKLVELRVLLSEVQTIDELFWGQERLFQPEQVLEEGYFLSAENVKNYVDKCLVRTVVEDSSGDILIGKPEELSSIFNNRRSERDFDKNRQIKFSELSELLNVIAQYSRNGEKLYCYPSAGGVYPVDCYLHFKENTVESVREGIYYYDTNGQRLKYVSSGKAIDSSVHYFINKDIFSSSAFSIYLFYNAEVSMPKYGARGYYYGLLDAGIMLGYLSIKCEEQNLGSCCIGSMDFDSIASEFKLNCFQKYLHTIEIGAKK